MPDVDEPQEPEGSAWWTGAKETAAVDVAEDVLSDEAIATRAGVSRRTLTNWKDREQFQDRVNEVRAEIRERSRRIGVGNQVLRIDRRNKRWAQFDRIIDKLANNLESSKVMGDMFMNRARTLAALHREELALEKQVALENGDWAEDSAGLLPDVKVE